MDCIESLHELITQCVGRQGDDSRLEPTILRVPYGLNY